MTYINDPELYDLARRSKMPAADKLYLEVTHKVLTTIRKKGALIDGENPFTEKDLPA